VRKLLSTPKKERNTMSNKTLKPFMLATGAMLLGGLAVSQSAFAVKQLGNGYQVTTPDGAKATEGKCGEGKCGEGKCGASKAKTAEGKCGEGKCGMAQADTNKDGVITKAEHTAHANSMFAAMDKNKDGKISGAEVKAKHEGKCGADKAKHEGKCGEGKCGAEKK
jgi:uncharacterized low-complexity protein